MSDEFFDTNVILYLLDDSPKAERAETLLTAGGLISVQVLNEALINCLRKAGMSWDEAETFLTGVRAICPVLDLTAETHDIGRALGARYQLSVYDAMIVASALQAGCQTLYSEDMQDGVVIEGTLRITNPFQSMS